MSYSTEGLKVSFIAENTISSAGLAVELGTSAQEVDLPGQTTSVAKPIVGITCHSASKGDAVAVQVSGVAECVSYAAIAKGARVAAAAMTGRIDDSESGTVGACYIGIALEASSGAGEIIPVLLNCPAVAEDGGAS